MEVGLYLVLNFSLLMCAETRPELLRRFFREDINERENGYQSLTELIDWFSSANLISSTLQAVDEETCKSWKEKLLNPMR